MKKRKSSTQQTLDKQPKDSDDDDNSSQDIVDVDFEFFDPKAEDFHGVKALLRSYLDDTAWDISSFVNIILEQSTVGTVIKTGEDESPIGVITALNLGRYKDSSSIKSVYKFLKDNIPESAKLEAIFDKRPNEVGLLVCERLINIPEELAPPLYKGIFDEISWATEDEQKKEHKQDRDGGNQEKFSEDIIYMKPEDELLHKIQGLKQFRLVMLLSADSMGLFKSQFCNNVEEQ